MAVISFGDADGKSWLIARWAYCRFLEDVRAVFCRDDAV